MNPELQKKIEDLINQKNIQENYENAMEHAPEVRMMEDPMDCKFRASLEVRVGKPKS